MPFILLRVPLLFTSGLMCLYIGLSSSVSAQQHLTHTVSHHSIVAKKHTTFAMPVASMPDAPTAVSLGLSANKQKWVTLAWQDAWNTESVKDTTFPMMYVKQIRQESGFQTQVVSSAGAIGIAQMEPSTASGLGVNPYDPVQSLQGGARLMVAYVHVYHSYKMALAAYNAGSGAMNGCLHTSDWYHCLPPETQNYITAIMN